MSLCYLKTKVISTTFQQRQHTQTGKNNSTNSNYQQLSHESLKLVAPLTTNSNHNCCQCNLFRICQLIIKLFTVCFAPATMKKKKKKPTVRIHPGNPQRQTGDNYHNCCRAALANFLCQRDHAKDTFWSLILLDQYSHTTHLLSLSASDSTSCSYCVHVAVQTLGCNLHPPRLFISVTASNQDTWCVISVLLRLGLPSRIPASEQPLWHQPVINILNKPADGWSLSHSVWKRCSHGGRRDGQQGPGEWMTAPWGNNLTREVDRDVITVLHCFRSDWVNLGHLRLQLRHICFGVRAYKCETDVFKTSLWIFLLLAYTL